MSFNNDDNDLVDEEARKEGERVRNDLMRGIFGDRDIAAGNGRRNLNSKFLARNEILEKKKKEDEKAQSEAFTRAQEALERSLKALEEQLESIRDEIEGHRKSIEAIGELRERIRNGTYNKNDEAVRSLLKSAGIDPADIDSDPQRAKEKLDREQTRHEKAIEELERLAKEHQKQINELSAAYDGHGSKLHQELLDDTKKKLSETEQRIKELREEGRDIGFKQKFNQRSNPQLEDRAKLETIQREILSGQSTENEVETFMKELAKAQKIENRTERLEHEQKLVSALSPAAADQLSMDQHTERLFSEDYFKSLGKESGMLSKDTPTAAANLLPG